MKLRPYQIEGECQIFNNWQLSDIVMFMLATGGGKTVTFVDVMKQFLAQNKRCLLIAHRTELINQAHETLYRNMIFAGVIMGNDPRSNLSLNAQVGSIQTVVRRKMPAPDLIVVDEGHHVTSENSYGKFIRSMKIQNPDLKILLVTATPYRMNGAGFVNILKTQETRLILNRSLFQLQQEGYLVKFRYFVSAVPDFSGVAKLANGEYDEEQSKKKIILADILKSYNKHAKGKQGLVFAVDVEHSKAIAEQYRSIGVNAVHIDANTPAIERAEVFRQFKAKEIQVVCNVGIATEGTDVPNVDFIQLARRVVSLSLYFQMVGRVSRALPGCCDGEHAQTVEERLHNIASSSKPYGIILDCAGAFEENPQIALGKDIDWRMHFNGTTKKQREKEVIDEQIEMFVYEAIDEKGNHIKTNKIKEIEGMELVEITKEIIPKVVNLVTLKQFDKYLALGKQIKTVKKVSYFALDSYLKWCKTNSYEVPNTAKRYIVDKLFHEPIKQAAADHEQSRRLYGAEYQSNQNFKKRMERYANNMMTKSDLMNLFAQYGHALDSSLFG